MAEITILGTQLGDEARPFVKHTLPVGETVILKGQVMRIHATTGKWMKAQGDVIGNLAGTTWVAAKTAYLNEPLTGMKQGFMDYGELLAALAFGANVWVSGVTAGMLTDVAPAAPRIVGTVVPVFGSGPVPDKILYVDM